MRPSFLDIRFPDRISAEAQGGPVFKTLIHQTDSGLEQRIQLWDDALTQYSFSLQCLNPGQIYEIISFFRIVCGRRTGFRFKDWSDYKLNDEVQTLTESTTFQVTKTYTYGGYSVIRRIKKLVPDSFVVKVNGIIVNASVDYNNGLITVPQSGRVTVSGCFDVPVRFDIDHLPTSLRLERYAELDNIPLQGVRV